MNKIAVAHCKSAAFDVYEHFSAVKIGTEKAVLFVRS